jgi:hypothetical protein
MEGGADAHEHSPPVPVVDVKVVLNDPALRALEVPSVRDLIADGSHDARGFSRFEDDHDCVGLGPVEIRVDEFVTTALGASTIGMLRFAARSFTQR